MRRGQIPRRANFRPKSKQLANPGCFTLRDSYSGSMPASQAEDAGPIPVSRSKTHLTRGVFCIEKQIDRIHFFDLDEIVIWRCENDPATQETTECRTPHSPEAL